MNVLFLSKDYPPHLIGGVGIYVYEMSRLLARMGHNVFIITKTDTIPCEYVDAGVCVYRVKSKYFRFLAAVRKKLPGFLERLEYSFAVSKKISEVVKAHQIDIIETCEARAEAFWYYSTHKRPALVIKLHTPETVAFKLDHTPETYDYRMIKLLEEHWVSIAAQCIGLSTEVVDLTEKHFSMKLNNVPLMPNPIDLEIFKPSLSGLKEHPLEVLYVGRLEFRKGVHTLMKAFLRVQEEIPQARLTLIGGDCGMRWYMEEKIKQLKNPELVQWIDQIPREALVEYYQRSAVCVVPSLWENYPYVCLEALACGKAVVASKIGGLKKIINDGSNGILVPPGSSKILGEAIIRLLKDQSLRDALGRQARAYIENEYAPEKIAQRTVEIYEQILSRRR